jgi:hypothetical protein
MSEVKAILAQVLPLIVRIDATLTATLSHLATKAELAEARSELAGDIGAIRPTSPRSPRASISGACWPCWSRPMARGWLPWRF